MEGRHGSHPTTRDVSSHQKLKEAGKASPGTSSQGQSAGAWRIASVWISVEATPLWCVKVGQKRKFPISLSSVGQTCWRTCWSGPPGGEGLGPRRCTPPPEICLVIYSLSCSQQPEPFCLYLRKSGTAVPQPAENAVANRFPGDIISSSGQELENHCSVSSVSD